MADILLVPGAFHGGWCWRPLAERLARLGHRAESLTLSGLGERRHLLSPAIDLETHIQDIVNAVRYRDLDRVVMVMHSYGGMPGTGAADRIADRVRALVWLDAYVPQDGWTVWDARNAAPGAVPLEPPADGAGMALPPATAFNIDGALADWVAERLTPHPWGTFVQPIGLTGAWQQVPKKLYVRCTRYANPALDASLATAAADPAFTTLSGDWPHNVMLTDPDWLAGVLLQHVL